ncbi:tetratricopeptide repeat protein [Brachyspira innocens]|uniref:Tetratricopeptide repeat protein n=1 Tax=Brachyspira innocens TaxID=13264 RepID=A0ABT8YXN4_9SPIR|nr:tetratricopeptide repeat protein [Brachyspira innocens]MDO7020112.1 tetratricopeptide repeat protein [Brachyspira innocens]
MPKIEDLERLGSIAFLIGNKALPKEISQEDYDRFKSVFTDEHMASSMPAEDNGLPSIDDLDSLDLPDDEMVPEDNKSSDDLDLPEDLYSGDDSLNDLGALEDLDLYDKPKDEDKSSNKEDDLGLPEDLGNSENEKLSADVDNLDLPENDDKLSADVDNLDLPESDDKLSADVDNLDLPESDDKLSADVDNLDLPESDDKLSADVDNLDLPESDDKLSADVDNLDLPENDDKLSADVDNLDLPESDDKLSADVDNLDLPENDDKLSADVDNLDLPESDDKLSADVDNLDLPESDDKLSADVDNLDLPEDLNDNALPADDDLGLPEDLDMPADDDLGLPEDLDMPADDDLGLPEDLDISDDDLNLDNLSTDDDDLGLPEDKELEDKIAKDINEADSVKNDIKADKLPVLNDDLPLPDTLPNVDDDYQDNFIDDSLENDDKENDLGIDDISDSLDDILEDDENLNELDNLENILDDDDKEESEDKTEENKEESSDDDLDNLSLDDVEEENKEESKEEPSDDDLDLDNLSLDDAEEEKPAESKEENEEESKEESSDDDLDLDNLSLDDAEEEKPAESKEENKEESKEESSDDDLDLDNLSLDDAEEEKPAESKDENKEEYKEEPSDDDLDLDNLSLDDAEEEKPAESKDENKEEYKEESSDNDLDNLSLDDAEEEKPIESKSEEDNKKEEFKKEEEHADDGLDLDIDNLDKEEASNNAVSNIVEGGTSLPAPETADNLPASKYDDVDKDIDKDKVISAIKNLSPLTQYHVLDTILNEKIDKDSMETLLNALERGESSENITELLNKELGLGIKEEGRKNVIDLIPIPNSLKDYGRIIRVAAVFLVLFVALVILSFQFIYKPVMANKYYKQGLVSISNGAYDEAERNFAEGERLKPKQIKWYNKYARAYIDRETFNNAFSKIQGALNIKPRDFETRITFGYYYRKKGEKELSEEDYVLGEQLYEDMLAYTSKKKEKETIYDERGLLMISRARNMLEPQYYDIAYTNYIDMITFFGDGVVPRKRGMLIKIYQDNYDHVKALQNHIELLKPGYIDDEVYPKLAQYLLDKDDFYGSRVLFEKLLTAYPNNLESIVGYADYETRLKHYDRAMELLNTAALPLYESNPFNKGKEYVYNMLGQIYYNLGEYGNAVRNFNEALAINEVYPDANYNLGNVYFYKDKDYAKAKQYYQMAYDNLAPNLRSDQLLYNLSWIYYSDGEYDSAFEGFNALFQKNPSNSVVSYALGNSLLHLDRANLANGFYRNALSQVLSKRSSLGRLEMRTERDFILISYLASLYNNIGVSYAYNAAVTNTVVNEQQAFKHFVLASEYFDQIRTSNIDLERAEKRTVLVDDQNIGAATYNIMSMQAKRNLKETTVIDDYIPKDMYYIR